MPGSAAAPCGMPSGYVPSEGLPRVSSINDAAGDSALMIPCRCRLLPTGSTHGAVWLTRYHRFVRDPFWSVASIGS